MCNILSPYIKVLCKKGELFFLFIQLSISVVKKKM